MVDSCSALLIAAGALLFLGIAAPGCGGGGGGEVTSVTVTPDEGGVVTSADGRLTLTIPPGAVTEPTTIRIERLPQPEDIVAVTLPENTLYDLQPDGLQFAVPVGVKLALTEADLAFLELAPGETPLGMLVLRDSTGTSEALVMPPEPGEETGSLRVSRDEAAGTLAAEATLSHFSSIGWFVDAGRWGREARAALFVWRAQLGEMVIGQAHPLEITVQRAADDRTSYVVVQEIGFFGDRDCWADGVLSVDASGLPTTVRPGPTAPECTQWITRRPLELHPDENPRHTVGPKPHVRCVAEGWGEAVVFTTVFLRQFGPSATVVFDSTVKGGCARWIAPDPADLDLGCEPPDDDDTEIEDRVIPLLGGSLFDTDDDESEAFGFCRGLNYGKYLDDQTQHSSLEVPPRPRAGDHTDTRAFGSMRLGLVDAAAVSKWQSLFPCGAGPNGLSLCPEPALMPPAGDYLVTLHVTEAEIPHSDPVNHYQYGFVYDQDDDETDNYRASQAYPNDFFQGTDRWYEANYTPAAGWTLKASDASGGTVAPIATEARIIISGSVIILIVPASEFEAAMPRFRVTAFRHTGDYGLNAPHDWDGVVTPPVASGLEPMR